MTEPILNLLDRLDAFVGELRPGQAPVTLYILGGAAVALTARTDRQTRDVDLVCDGEGLEAIEADIESRFSRAAVTPPSLYVELVSSGLPPLPSGWRGRATAHSAGRWSAIGVFVLSPIDLALTKARRFSLSDRADIESVLGRAEVSDDDFAAIAAGWCWAETDWRERAEPNLERIRAWLRGEVGRI